VRVRVKGTLNADKNLIAEKIILILGAKVDDEGLVQATDIVKNTMTLNGVTFETTADTSFNDRSKAKVRLFSLKDVVTGDFVEVRGHKLAATTSTPERIIATRIERKNPSEKDKDGFKTEIKGVIESVVDDTIKVSGHTIKVTSTTQLKGFNTIQAFLSGAVGLEVEIKGVIENDVFIALVIEVEDDEHESHSSSSKSSTSNSSSSKSSSSKSSSSLSSATSKSSSSQASTSSTSSTASSVAASSVSSASSAAASSLSSVAAVGDAVLGKTLYDAATYSCAACHGAKGGTIAIDTSKSVASMALYITQQMPPSNKGACNTQCGRDIAAYIKTW
jgi:cytochrome c553